MISQFELGGSKFITASLCYKLGRVHLAGREGMMKRYWEDKVFNPVFLEYTSNKSQDVSASADTLFFL